MDAYQKAIIVLTALYFLSVRSEAVIDYLMANTHELMYSFDNWVSLYKAICLNGTPFLGLKNKEGAKRGQHTTEQKNLDGGPIIR